MDSQFAVTCEQFNFVFFNVFHRSHSGSSCVQSIGSTVPTLVGFVVELKAELFYVMHVCEVLYAMMPIAEMNETIYHNAFFAGIIYDA